MSWLSLASTSTIFARTCDRTRSPRPMACCPIGVRRDRLGVHASWEVDTAMDWLTYAGWAKARVPADFSVVSEDDSSLTVGMTMPGDFYSLRLSPVPSISPLRVRAEFDGRPH